MKGNVGEWSELYVLLKLLAEGSLSVADAQGAPHPTQYYPITDIRRGHGSLAVTYVRGGVDTITVHGNDFAPLTIPIADFSRAAAQLRQELLNPQRPGGAFELPHIWEFAHKVGCTGLKAPSRDKADIFLTIHDSRTACAHTLGFSIKSQIAGASTLLNASQATNLCYSLQGPPVTAEQCRLFAEQGTFKARFAYLDSLGVSLCYMRAHPTFMANLSLIDTGMPPLLATLVEYYYRGRGSTMADLTALCVQHNPLAVPLNIAAIFYPYKVKELLMSIALGMVPARPWPGHYEATGGYIIVKNTGDTLCYHSYNRNQFREYLFSNTRLETASTARHTFGTVVQDTNGQYIELNAQIRFTH